MIGLRLAIPVTLCAAVAAACFTYLVAEPPPVEADQLKTPAVFSNRAQDAAIPKRNGQLTDDEEKAVAAFQRAADAILRRAENLQAAVTNEHTIRGKIPLPRKRPIPR